MNLKIEGYKTLLRNITIAQDVQFHREATAGIAPFAAKINGIANAFDTYKENVDRLDTEFTSQIKSIETGELVILDSKRDATTLQIINRVDYHAKFPETGEEADAAKKLQFVTEIYRDAPRKNYQAETSYLRSMIEDLKKQANALQRFELTATVNRLERENNDFETLYLTRTGNIEIKRERGTLTELSLKANATFDVVCQIVNGLLLMSLDAETKDALEKIAGFVNGQIHQYTVVYHRHTGAAAKKNNGDKTAESDDRSEEEIM